MFVASHQELIDYVENTDPDMPNGIDEAADEQREIALFNLMEEGGFFEEQHAISTRWADLGCEPQDLNSVLYVRVNELTYDSPVGQYLVEVLSNAE